MKKNLFIFLSVFIFLFFGLVFIESLPIYVKPTDGSGNLFASTTFNYTFNFTLNPDCSGVLLSNDSVITTGDDGVGFVDVNTSNLFSVPRYLCEYWNGSFRKTHVYSDLIVQDIFSRDLTTYGDINISNETDTGFFYDSSLNRVGIGTTSPSNKLDVRGVINASGEIYVNNGTAVSGFAKYLFTDNNFNGSGNFTQTGYGRTGIGTENPTAKLDIYVDNSVYSKEPLLNISNQNGAVLYINDSNIGIGTANPGADLEISVGAASTNLRMRRTDLTPDQYWDWLMSGATGDLYWEPQGQEADIYIRDLGNTVSLQLDNSENSLYIPNGSVGIGTTSPGQELVVASSDVGTQISLQNEETASAANFQDVLFRQKDSGGTVNNFAIIRQDPTNVTAGSENGQLQFQVMDGGSIASRLTIDGDKVGIGTTSPDGKLHVAGDVIAGRDGGKDKLFINEYDAGISYITVGDLDRNKEQHLWFQPRNSGGGIFNLLKLDGSGEVYIDGNVGIGTTSPDYDLHLENTGGDSVLAVTDTSGTAKISVGYTVGEGMDIFRNSGTADIFFNATQGNGAIRFQDRGTDTLTIDNTGNVGIGTNSPQYPLHVGTSTSQANGSISIWANKNISATGFITRTSVYDKSKGNALDIIKDAEEYKEVDGSINHSAFYGSASWETADTSRPVNITEEVEVCNEVPVIENVCNEVEVCGYEKRPLQNKYDYICSNKTQCSDQQKQNCNNYFEEQCDYIKVENETYHQQVCKDIEIQNCTPVTTNECHIEEQTTTTYPHTKVEEGIELGHEIDLLRQAIYELNNKGSYNPNWIKNSKDIYYNSGNVGIGVSNPSAALEVDGEFIVSEDITQQRGSYHCFDKNCNAYMTYNGSRMFIKVS